MTYSLKKNYSKAESLSFLKSFENKFSFTVPPFIYFTQKKYLMNKNLIFNQIEKKFKKKISSSDHLPYTKTILINRMLENTNLLAI